MTTRLVRRIRGLRRRWMVHAAILRASWIWLGGALLLGAVVLSLRFKTPDVPAAWFYAWPVLLTLALLAGWRAARGLPDEEQIAAWFDARGRFGGAVLAARAYGEELPLATQDQRLERASRDVVLSPRGALLRIACGLGLALAPLLWPLQVDAAPERRELLQALVQRAAERWAELETDASMSREEREALRDRLQDLAERALSDTDPTRLLEALGDIEQRMEEGAQRALAAAERALASRGELAPDPREREENLAAQWSAKFDLEDLPPGREGGFEGETAEQRALFGAREIETGTEAQSSPPAEMQRALESQRAAHLRRWTPSQRRAVESFSGMARKREAGR